MKDRQRWNAIRARCITMLGTLALTPYASRPHFSWENDHISTAGLAHLLGITVAWLYIKPAYTTDVMWREPTGGPVDSDPA